MLGIPCPKCGKPTETLINSDEWKYYCSVCNLRFNIKKEAKQKPGHPEIETLSGRPRCLDYAGPAPCPIDEKTGMHQDYWILSDEERAKGFVRPVRTKYIHNKCGSVTYMNIKLAETYAADPGFYSATFCVNCRQHFPLDQFRWINADGTTGEGMNSNG